MKESNRRERAVDVEVIERNPPPRWVQWLGWYGTVAIVGAYALLSFGVLREGAVYQLLNLTGAFGVGLICWWRRTWQPFWLEVVWGVVALLSLARVWLA